jgi:hypothetical protein
MQSQKRTISPKKYFILIFSLTFITLFLMSVISNIVIFQKLWSSLLLVIIFYLLWEGIIVGFITWFSYKKAHNKDFLVKFMGSHLGRYLGLVIGGLLGAQISKLFGQKDLLGFFIGGVIFYYVGRWIGAKVSIAIASQVDKIYLFSGLIEPENIVEQKASSRLPQINFIIYCLIPIIFMIFGFLIKYFGIQVGWMSEYLSAARIVAIILSIYTIIYPWIMRKRWLLKYATPPDQPEPMVYLLGLAISIAPSLYGFALFIAMGISITELCVFEVVSMIAIIIWGMKNKPH